MKSVLRLAQNDLRLTLRDRPAFFWLLVLPLAMMWFFGQMTRDDPNAPPRVRVSIVDLDGGWLASAFLDALEDESLELVRLDPDGWEDVEDKVRTLIVPAGFTAGLLAGEKQDLRLVKDEGSSESFGVAGEVHTFRAIARTLGILVEMSEAGTLANADAERIFAELDARPDTVTLDVDHVGTGRPVPSGYGQSVPGTLTFIVLMMTLIYGAVYLTLEKQSGMLRRQVSLPISRGRLIAGKLVGRLMIAGMQLIVLGLAGAWFFDVPWGRAPAALILMMISYAAAVAAIATWLGAILANAQQASIVGWLAAMAMAALGGCWWPSEVMPTWLQTVALITPPAWAMKGFHSIVTFGRGLESVWVPALALWGFALVFVVLGARTLRAEARA